MEAASSKNRTQIVQIRKRGGLKSIKNTQGIGLQPRLFHQEVKDPNNEGTPMGDYKGKTILDTKYFLSPMWNDLKDKWSWAGTEEQLGTLIKKMKLRYDKGHEKEGQLIESGVPAERLTHRRDPVFINSALYGKYFMESGRASLNLSDPIQEFLYLCYKGDHLTADKSTDATISKYISAGTKFEIVSPRKEGERRKQDASKEIKAITLLAAMDGNDWKIRAVCEIMDLPGYDQSTEITGAWLLLKDMGAQNTEKSSKYGKSYQDRFVEVAGLSDEDLKLYHDVITAKNRGLLRRRQGYYISYDGSRIENINSEAQLISYFQLSAHQDEYIELLEHLNDARDQH